MTKLLTHIQPTIVPAGTFYSPRLSTGLPGSGACFAPDEKGAGGSDEFLDLPPVPKLPESYANKRHRASITARSSMTKIDALIRRLILLRNDRAEEHEISEAFVQIGEPAVPALTGLLQEGRTQFIRARAAKILGNMGHASAVIPLCEMLDAPGVFCQEAVARALGEIGDKRAAKPLVDKLFRAKPNVRIAIIEALGNIGGEELTVPLGRMLHIRNLQVRLTAMEAIRKTGGEAAIEPLIGAFTMQNRHFRRKIRDALLEFGKQAIPHLNRALEDEHPWVRQGAQETLEVMLRSVHLLLS